MSAPVTNPIPPAVYAHVNGDAENRRITYAYNGQTIVRIEISGRDRYNFRSGSDGVVQSAPLLQQTFLSLPAGARATATVTFSLGAEAVAMRPHRARREQAVVGSCGGALPVGINGLHDKEWDLLLDWHGRPWRWKDHQLRRGADGRMSAKIEVELGEAPWLLNVRPRFYQQHLGYAHHRPWERLPNQKAVAGWCSWEAFRREISEEKLAVTADFLARHFRDYGLEYVQIDDGYQRRPVVIGPGRSLADAWTEPSASFPSGIGAAADRIKALGMRPGIWMSADIGEIKAEADGATCQLMDADGKPFKAFWMNAVLDCRPETLERQVRPLYAALRDKGFGYVKIDQIRHLLCDALQEAVRQGLIAEDEATARFRNYMRLAREALGPETYCLASWGVLSEVVGYADACRIAQDANPKWPAVRMQIVESARWFHAQRILFLNDPDHVCARTKPEWMQSLLSLVSLSGQLLMLSDTIADYDLSRVQVIQRCLPPLTTTTAETGPLDAHYPAFTWIKQHGAQFQGEIEASWDEVSEAEALAIAGYSETMDADHPLASLWAFHLANEALGSWCVALRIGTIPLRASRLRVAALGLDERKVYLAFDFWNQTFLGEVTGALEVPALALGHCQAIALREKRERPQFLASTRHVSMGAVGLRAERWSGSHLEWDVAGVVDSTETFWVHAPAHLGIPRLSAVGAEAVVTGTADGLTALEVCFHAAEATLHIQYGSHA